MWVMRTKKDKLDPGDMNPRMSDQWTNLVAGGSVSQVGKSPRNYGVSLWDTIKSDRVWEHNQPCCTRL